MTEDQLEQDALSWLVEVGYTHLSGYDIAPDGPAPERDNFRQVLLPQRLRSAIARLNQHIPLAAREDAFKQVQDLGTPVLLSANRHFHRLLVGGVPVQYQQDGETRGDFVRLVDWGNAKANEWLAVNQFSLKGPHHTRRPDIMLFLNGLPVVLLELKNPADENASIWKAYEQIQTYKAQIPDVFQYNEVLVVSDGSEALMGSLSSNAERFMAWRTIDGVALDPLGQFNELETLVRGVLAPAYLLDYLRYFVLFEDDGGLVKKIAGYHQFHAVRAAIEQVVAASRPGGSHKGGVVWHTQGSGKSITMTCFAARVMQEPAMQNPTIVVITDRNDLDGQLFGVFSLGADLLREQPVQVEIVMTGSASDKALLRPHIYSGQVKKRLEKRFKDPGDPLRLVIVRDMWLTGFDAPCVHTLYVDKPMKGHNLMQAIARVNRVFKDKQGGLVVDYIGIGNELKAAMKEYTASKGRGKPTVDAHEAYAVLEEKLDVLRAMLHGFDYSGFITGGHKVLAGAANHVLGLKSEGRRDGNKRFADTALAMSKAFSLCCTLDEAKAVREEVAFMQAVKVILTKKDITRQKKTDEQRELAIRQIIGSAVVSDRVVDIFDAVGLDKPDIGLLDDEFLAQVKNLPERNLAVELLERLLEGEIKSRFATNVVQERKFSELLGNVIKRYQNRSIETAQVMEELVDMARRFREAASRGESLGLSEDEVKFYDALILNESAARELSDETLKKIAHELTTSLRQNISVDWAQRESVRAKLRLMVKRILRKYKYPPDSADAAVELVLEQAETIGEEWVE